MFFVFLVLWFLCVCFFFYYFLCSSYCRFPPGIVTWVVNLYKTIDCRRSLQASVQQSIERPDVA